MKRFLIVGDANVDIILSGLTSLPVMGQELEAANRSLLLGGSAANCACWLAGLGAEVAFWGRVGEDEFGGFVVRAMQALGIDVTGLIRDPDVPTGLCIALSYPSERALISHLGTVATLQLADLPLSELSRYGHLHSSSIFLQHRLRPALTDLFRAAKDAGLTTSLDCGWDPANRWDVDLASLLPHVDVFLPNEAEALHLTGAQHVEETLPMLGRYGSTVIVKRGKDGALAGRAGQVYQAVTPPIDCAESTGAGDCFNAGVLYALYWQGQSLPDALQFASACGAAGASMPGGSSIFLSPDDFLQFSKTLSPQNN